MKERRRGKRNRNFFLSVVSLIIPPWTALIAIIPPDGAHSENEFYSSSGSIVGAFWSIVAVCSLTAYLYIPQLNVSWSLEFFAEELKTRNIYIAFNNFRTGSHWLGG